MNQSKYLYNTFIIILFINKIRVGKTCLTKMISNNTFEESYKQTIIISIANKTAILTDNSKIQLKLIDSPGNLDFKNLNTISKILNKLKALFIVFDLTNQKSFEKIKDLINKCQKYIDENNKGDKNKQPKTFSDLPILVIGNKKDLTSDIKVKKAEVQDFVDKLQKEKKLVYINYHEVSVKENKGIENLYQDIIFFYNQTRINTKLTNQQKEINNSESTNIEETGEIKKPNLNKNMMIFHQMLDKVKKPLINEISRLKEENKKEKLNLEKKIDDSVAKFKKEKNLLMEKIKSYENKNKDINLKFKITNIEDVITIKAKGDSKLFEVLNMLYELCPGMSNLKIDGFSVEGKKDIKIDEMKTVSENKLDNNSILIINSN